MGLRYRPRIKIGNATFGKTGVSFRTGIPGLTFRHDYKKSGNSYAASVPDGIVRPNIPGSLLKIFLLIVGMFFAALFLGVLFSPQWYFFTPFLFLWFVIKPAIGAITGKIDGEELTTSERNVLTFEGIAKLVVFGYAIITGYPKYASDVEDLKFPRPPFQMKNLSVGSPVANIKKAELKKAYLSTDWNITYKGSKYANEVGETQYSIEDHKITKIEFTKRGDMGAYPRLLKLLYAKYGPTRDSTATQSSWSNDSLSFRIQQIDKDVSVSLEPNMYYQKK